MRKLPQKRGSEASAQKIKLILYLSVYVTCVVLLRNGLSPLSLNPSVAIRVYKTVVIPTALYGSELWSSMTPVDLRKLEHSHIFCLNHMQGLSRRTPTNFTLFAINAVPMESSDRSQKAELSWTTV